MNWNHLRIFHYVAQYKSFTRTAERLNITQPAISQSIQLLEDRLGTTLFDRTSKGLLLTKAGDVFHGYILKAFAEIDAAEKFIKGSQEEEVTGELTILTTHGLAYTWVIYFLPTFRRLYPHLNVRIVGDDQKKDLNGVDVAILPFLPNQPNLIQRYLASFCMRLFASREYLEQNGVPQTPADLVHHTLIIYGDNAPASPGELTWLSRERIKNGYSSAPFIEINSAQGRMNAARLGLGIAELTSEYAQNEGADLIEVLPGYAGPTIDVYYTYPKQMELSKRVTALGDHITETLGLHPFPAVGRIEAQIASHCAANEQ